MEMKAALAVLGALAVSTARLPASEAETVAAEIRAAAVQPEDGPLGRPLPLASHWCTGHHRFSAGYAPAAQIALIERGHRVLPAFHLHDTADMGLGPAGFAEYFEGPLKRAAALRLPICFVSTQWEYLLSEEPCLSLPADKNPNVVTADGKVLREVCPFGPLDPWREAGRRWSGGEGIRRLQEWFPDPPRVIFVSNNEHPRLTWSRAEESRRYIEAFGRGRDGEFRRKVVGDGWIERHRALHAAMREGLSAPAWRSGATFVGYEAFGPSHLGRWAGWPEYSLHAASRTDPSPLMWDGGSPSYYTHNWCPISDYQVWSPQVEAMNWLFMLDEARRINPGFWFEMSVWDGSDRDEAGGDKPPKSAAYAAAGQSYGPPRYAGFVQFGMWLLRPRVVREFRGWIHRWESGGPYFLAVCEAVDRVHADAELREFWRHGRLVPNRSAKHPYQENLPAWCESAERWFLLDTDLAPPRPWKLDTAIPVFALALETGKAPERRWLVYAHAPLGERKGVKVVIPGFREVAFDVPVAGAFHVADERTGQVVPR